MDNWKDFTAKCLDIALDYFEKTTNSNRAEFLGVVIDQVHKLAVDDTITAHNLKAEEKKVEKPTIDKKYISTTESKDVNFSEDLVSTVGKKYTKHMIEHGKSKGHTDKSLFDKFGGASVYIGDRNRNGIQDSIAEIVRGDDSRSKDCLKLFKTGSVLTVTEYLEKFGVPTTNTSRIRFTENPMVSFWMLKNTHCDTIKNMDDLRNYSRNYSR